jgi:hypothetical protein
LIKSKETQRQNNSKVLPKSEVLNCEQFQQILATANQSCTEKTNDVQAICCILKHCKTIDGDPSYDQARKLLTECRQFISSKNQAELDRFLGEEFRKSVQNSEQMLSSNSNIINEEEIEEQALVEAEFAVYSTKNGSMVANNRRSPTLLVPPTIPASSLGFN